MNQCLLPLVAALAVALAACSKNESPAPVAAPAAPAAVQPAAPAPLSTARHSGRIVQVMQGGGYTYAEVDLGGGQRVWVAGASLQAGPGDTVEWGDHAVMRNFNAKSLNRSFDEILFVSAWGVAGGSLAQVAPHGTPPAGAHPAPGPAAAPGGAHQGLVRSAVSAAGYTYLEVDQGGAVVWLAVPETTVKAGDKVSWADGPTMQNFTAKSLNRSFERIVFAAGVVPVQ